jgi:hypothetical protein
MWVNQPVDLLHTGKFARAFWGISTSARGTQKQRMVDGQNIFATDVAAIADRVRSRSADQSDFPVVGSKNYSKGRRG